jgi:AbrB family looped-hinge helix DNA binding protein
MDSIKASSKGQMVIPKPIREALAIRSGTELNVELDPGKGFNVTLAPTDPAARVRRLAGSLAHRAKHLTPAEEEAGLLAAVRADDERTKSRGRRRR